MTIKYKVGDTVLIKAEVTGVYITDKKNKPQYGVRVKGYGTHEAYGISVGEETICNLGDNNG